MLSIQNSLNSKEDIANGIYVPYTYSFPITTKIKIHELNNLLYAKSRTDEAYGDGLVAHGTWKGIKMNLPMFVHAVNAGYCNLPYNSIKMFSEYCYNDECDNIFCPYLHRGKHFDEGTFDMEDVAPFAHLFQEHFLERMFTARDKVTEALKTNTEDCYCRYHLRRNGSSGCGRRTISEEDTGVFSMCANFKGVAIDSKAKFMKTVHVAAEEARRKCHCTDKLKWAFTDFNRLFLSIVEFRVVVNNNSAVLPFKIYDKHLLDNFEDFYYDNTTSRIKQ